MKTKQFVLPLLAAILAVASAFTLKANEDLVVAPDFIEVDSNCTQIPLECTHVIEAPICTYDVGGNNYVQVFDEVNPQQPTQCRTELRHWSMAGDGKLN